jgi:hypothetical protein
VPRRNCKQLVDALSVRFSHDWGHVIHDSEPTIPFVAPAPFVRPVPDLAASAFRLPPGDDPKRPTLPPWHDENTPPAAPRRPPGLPPPVRPPMHVRHGPQPV